jgi:DNA-binding NarL/FixJ family response regulator
MVVRVVIADDDYRACAAFADALTVATDLRVVGLAENGAVLVRMAAAVSCDVAVVDLRMPGLDAATTITRLLAQAPHVRVLLIVPYDTDSQLPRAIAAGAIGYVLKTVAAARLVAAVRRAAYGGEVNTAEELARVGEVGNGPPGEAAVARPLTAREREVLALVCSGLRNDEVASRLHIGKATVRMHLSHAYAKLGVHERPAAIAEALRCGVILDTVRFMWRVRFGCTGRSGGTRRGANRTGRSHPGPRCRFRDLPAAGNPWRGRRTLKSVGGFAVLLS